MTEFVFRVGVKLPVVEVRYKNLYVEAECQLVHGKPFPTLWNATKSMLSVSICVCWINFSDYLIIDVEISPLSF